MPSALPPPARRLRQLTAALLLAAAPSLSGQMLAGTFGRLHDTSRRDFTYTWRMDYRHQVAEGWALSLGWMNEGHVPDHHRDGPVLEGWRHVQLGETRLRAVVGAGLYRAYDTVPDAGGGYLNRHGVRGLTTLGLWMPFGADGQWLGLLEATRTFGGWTPQTQSISLGAGWRMGRAFGQERIEASAAPRALAVEQSLTLFYGTTILNSFRSEQASAYQLEYRRSLTPFWDWSVAYTNEGTPAVLHREGVVGQAWLGGWFLDQRFQASLGFGPYANRVTFLDAQGLPTRVRERISGRVTLGLAWRFQERLLGRLAWNRTTTTLDRDSDVIVLGAGLAW